MLLLLFLITGCEGYTVIKKEMTPQDTTPANVTEPIQVNETNETIVEIKETEVFIPRKSNLTVFFLDIKGSSSIIQYKGCLLYTSPSPRD